MTVHRPDYTGRIARSEDGRIKGVIRDVFGYEVHLELATDDAPGYAVTGFVRVPEAMRLPGLDDVMPSS